MGILINKGRMGKMIRLEPVFMQKDKILYILLIFYCFYSRWCYDADTHRERLVEVMFPLLLDASTEGLAELVSVEYDCVSVECNSMNVFAGIRTTMK